MHSKELERLINEDFAYISKESSGDREEVIRFKNPNKKITFKDIVRDDITFDTEELGDFVIALDTETPLFHLAVVVDDNYSGVNVIIRGEDHISNTPRQILIREALGYPPAEYAHIPLVLAEDRSKLSKRHGAEPIADYKEQGILPEALLNYMSLLGWNPKDNNEILTPTELISKFSLDGVQKGGAVFNKEKMLWFNKEHMGYLDNKKFTDRVKLFLPKDLPNINMSALVDELRERLFYFSQVKDLFHDELLFIKEAGEHEGKTILWKKEPSVAITKQRLEKVHELLLELEDWPTPEKTKEAVWSFAEREGKGEVLWPLRVALSGQKRSPDPFTCFAILGKNESLKRIDTAVKILSKM